MRLHQAGFVQNFQGPLGLIRIFLQMASQFLAGDALESAKNGQRDQSVDG